MLTRVFFSCAARCTLKHRLTQVFVHNHVLGNTYKTQVNLSIFHNYLIKI